MNLLNQFFTGEDSFLSVDDDDMVTTVNVRSKGGLVLTAQDHCDLGGKTAQDSTIGVDENPVALDLALLGVVSRFRNHLDSSMYSTCCYRDSRGSASNPSILPRSPYESTGILAPTRVSAHVIHEP